MVHFKSKEKGFVMKVPLKLPLVKNSDKRSKVLVMNPIFIANMKTMLSEIAAYIQYEATLASNAPPPKANGHSLNGMGPPPSSAAGTGNGYAPPDQPHTDPPPAPS